MMSKSNKHRGSPADPDSNLSAAACLSDVQAEFAAHMDICGPCYEMQPCWQKVNQGRNFQMKFKQNPSELYKAAATALKQLPYDDQYRVVGESLSDWLKELYGIKNECKPRSGHVCTRRLKGSRSCSIRTPCPSPTNIPCGDHFTEWMKDGKTFSITFEPYGLTHDCLLELTRWAGAEGFKVAIYAESWHFPMNTLLVEIRQC